MRAEHVERIAVQRMRERFDLATIRSREVRTDMNVQGSLRVVFWMRAASRARPLTGMSNQDGRFAAS